MSNILPPDYTELSAALVDAKLNFSTAQVHGLFCGFICAGNIKDHHAWEKQLFGTQKIKDAHCLELLQQLYELTHQQLKEFSFEFSLFLPDDETDINLRAEALGLWCQGFVTGLQPVTGASHNPMKDEIQEALNDITEIAQVNYGDIADDDEDEVAYFELVEYVRLAALMIYHELKSGTPHHLTTNDPLH